MRRFWFFPLVFTLMVFLAVSCAPATPTTAPEQPTAIPTNTLSSAPPTATVPPAKTDTISPASGEESTALDGQAILERSCTACHSLDRVVNKKASADDWSSTVTRMVNKGAVLTSDEQAALIQYLAENYK